MKLSRFSSVTQHLIHPFTIFTPDRKKVGHLTLTEKVGSLFFLV